MQMRCNPLLQNDLFLDRQIQCPLDGRMNDTEAGIGVLEKKGLLIELPDGQVC
jgi:hypothetical protein